MAGNINHALRAATGDFVVMLDHDDTLAPFALHALARAVAAQPDVDFLYSDCDKLDEKGHRCEPFFKPDWSPELLLGVNYLEHVAVFRRSLLDRVGWLDPACGGAYDWDFYLRIAEHTQAFAHVPQVLHHWRKTPASTAQDIGTNRASGKARSGRSWRTFAGAGWLEPTAEFDDRHPIHNHFPRLTWKIPVEPAISVVIPTLDHAELLSVCLDGLFHRTSYANIRIVLVDTGSKERATQKLYASLAGRPNLRIVEYREPFNFSQACNVGVRHADGDLVLLLNNDIEMLHDDWLSRMVQWFEIPERRCRRAEDVLPERADAPRRRGDRDGRARLDPVHRRSRTRRFDLRAGGLVSQSVRGVRRLPADDGGQVYDELGGLDEAFLLNYSDVDFCVRATERGHRVVFTPDARIVHHESVTHGRRVPRGDFVEASRSFARLLRHGDPFFNPNLSCYNCYPSLRRDRRDRPADANDDLLARLPHKAIIQLPDDLAERPD